MKQVELFNDHFQNFKKYLNCKAQLIIADPPYNLGKNAYASNPQWYVGGDNKNGESEFANKEFFDTDKNFKPAEFMHFCSQMLVKEPKNGLTEEEIESGEYGQIKDENVGGKKKSQAPCMILFCAFEQMHYYIELGQRYGFKHYIPLVFYKNFSPQVLKANMKIVGNCEYGLVLYKDKLPKFNNNGKMVFNAIPYPRDTETIKVHPCLPKGEKVYINNDWVNIEDVKIGDCSKYGEVTEISSHIANKIIEIETENGTTRATWNHPFLILRDNEIAWVYAEQIKETDFILWRTDVKKFISPQRKGISDCDEVASQEWNTSLFGNGTMGKSQMVTKSTTLTATNRTIILKTYNLSQPLSTNGYTRVASLNTENGINHVQYAESTKNATPIIGISQEGGLTGVCVKNATAKKFAKEVEFTTNKIKRIKVINKDEVVYNLSISNTPAFDTQIGCSHNTQKSVPLLRYLIELFTDKGDVVIDPCVDADTEYFNGNEWKKISEYVDGDSVLVYDMTSGNAHLEQPARYLKQPYNKPFIRYKSYAIDIMATPDHNIVNYNTMGVIRKTPFSKVWEDNQTKVNGFRGLVPLSFNIQTNNDEYNEWYLRLMVACQADGSVVKNNKYRIRVLKDRKIKRMRWLLSNANIEYTEGVETSMYKGKQKIYASFVFNSPYGCKIFDWNLLYAKKEYKEIILDELKYWDGNIQEGGCVRYSTTVKHNADFVQLLAHTCNKSARISVDKRNDKPCYNVSFSKWNKAKLSKSYNFGNGQIDNMSKVEVADKHCYCFTVSSGAFVVRRNGKIHITGNCAGSGSSLLAAAQCGRRAYGFEIKKDFYKLANEKILANIQQSLF